MSDRDTPEHEERVSPYLLRPARTYEEYLRDREQADQIMARYGSSDDAARTDRDKASQRHSD